MAYFSKSPKYYGVVSNLETTIYQDWSSVTVSKAGNDVKYFFNSKGFDTQREAQHWVLKKVQELANPRKIEVTLEDIQKFQSEEQKQKEESL